MTSKTDIANLALAEIGVDVPIAAFTDQTKNARAISRLYPQALAETLEAHAWGFALKSVALALEAQTPAIGWRYRYSKPGDCLKILGIADESRVGCATRDIMLGRFSDSGLMDYAEAHGDQGTSILCNIEKAHLIYTAHVEDATRYPPTFIKALALCLATKLAVPCAGDLGLKMGRDLEFKYEMALAKAGTMSHGQSKTTEHYVTPSMRARNQ